MSNITQEQAKKIHDLSEAAAFLMENPEKASEEIRPLVDSLNEAKSTYEKISEELKSLLQQKSEIESKLFDILTAKGRIGAIVENVSASLFCNMTEQDMCVTSDAAKKEET